MKLVCVYNVVRDEQFLVELIEDNLTLEGLENGIGEHGIPSQI
jgi:hypothetical protein